MVSMFMNSEIYHKDALLLVLISSAYYERHLAWRNKKKPLVDTCASSPPHSPFGKAHGGPDSIERHVGDLGNVVADSNGVATFSIVDPQIRLRGDTHVLGRSLVVHRDEDDYGTGTFEDSKTTGHSGPRLACGVIALAKNE
jgi:superoxide dismutase, Cu-Zn family